MAKNKYDASAIEWKKGLAGLRAKLGMYLGETDSRGLTHIVKELVGNSIDEASNKHATDIQVVFHKDGSVTVSDNGRGIPVGPSKDDKTRDTLDVLFTEVHSGGKLSANSSYTSSIGTHGVGLTVVNACSLSLKVWSFSRKKWECMEFKKGVPVNKKPKLDSKFPAGLDKPKRGTVVWITPDLSLFNKGSKLDPVPVQQWISEMAWFVPAKFTVIVEATNKRTVVHREHGLKSRFKYECKKNELEALSDPFVVQGSNYDIVIGWTSGPDPLVSSYVSGVKTVQGGTHLNGFNQGLKTVFELVAKRGDKFSLDGLTAGMVAVVNVRLQSPKFNSQDKQKLSSEEAKKIIVDALTSTDKTSLFSWAKKNKDTVRQIIDRANELTKLESGFKADKALASKLKDSRGKVNLPKSLMTSSTKDDSLRELFVVEGESAAGCLHGKTKVRLSDGQSLEFEKLVKLWEAGVAAVGFGYNPKTKMVNPAVLNTPRITKQVTELVEITLSNGKKVLLTPDHKCMLENGRYVQAQNLKPTHKLKTI